MTFEQASELLKKATKKSKFTFVSGLVYDIEYRMEIGENVPSELIEAKKVLGYK